MRTREGRIWIPAGLRVDNGAEATRILISCCLKPKQTPASPEVSSQGCDLLNMHEFFREAQ